MMDAPEQFQTEAEKLEEALKLAGAPPHVCFLGTNEGDDLMRMAVARFLQRKMQHVSVVRGGYKDLYMEIEKRNQTARLLEGLHVEASVDATEDPLLEVPVETKPQSPERVSRLGRLLRKGGSGANSLSGSKEALDTGSGSGSAANSEAGGDVVRSDLKEQLLPSALVIATRTCRIPFTLLLFSTVSPVSSTVGERCGRRRRRQQRAHQSVLAVGHARTPGQGGASLQGVHGSVALEERTESDTFFDAVAVSLYPLQETAASLREKSAMYSKSLGDKSRALRDNWAKSWAKGDTSKLYRGAFETPGVAPVGTNHLFHRQPSFTGSFYPELTGHLSPPPHPGGEIRSKFSIDDDSEEEDEEDAVPGESAAGAQDDLGSAIVARSHQW